MKPRQWTDAQIADALRGMKSDGVHEHPDCIRMAGEWLDAQPRSAHPNAGRLLPIKHLVENWGKRYVSAEDVSVAAKLQGIAGRYPYFAIRPANLVLPSRQRLNGIGQAGAHPNYDTDYGAYYQFKESTDVESPLQRNC